MSEARRCIMGGLLLLLVALSAAGCRSNSARAEGPLEETSGNRSWSSAPLKRGQFLVVGVFTPNNKSGHDLVLEHGTE